MGRKDVCWGLLGTASYKKKGEQIKMEQFFLDLKPAIEEAVRHAMEKIRREIGQEHIYSVALVTDSDCITLFLAVNTEELWRNGIRRTRRRSVWRSCETIGPRNW